MLTPTPPRSSVDRERLDMRMVSTPSRQRPGGIPSNIPLPASLTTPNAIALSGLSSRPNSAFLARPGDYPNGRMSVDDGYSGRSSSLSVRGGAATSSSFSLNGSSIVAPSRPSFSAGSDIASMQRPHPNSSTSPNMNAGTSDVAYNERAESRSDSFNAFSSGASAAGDSEDGERILPVKVAVRIRPLVVANGEGLAEQNGIGRLPSRVALSSCLEARPNASILVSPAASAAAGIANPNLTSSVGSLSPVLNGSDDMAGFGGFVRQGNVGGAGVPHSSSTQGLPRTFNFDYVFGPESQQQSVYDAAISPLLARFVEGYNVTILAYGQTSSGKTYTMGTDAEDTSLLSDGAGLPTTGIIPRALRWIFQWVHAQNMGSGNGENSGFTSLNQSTPRASPVQSGIDARISFLEVYNEVLIDLIAQRQCRGVRPPIFIREDTKGNILWTGVKEVPVADAHDAMAILIDGSHERQTGVTRMNEKSSRSHAIYTISLTQTRLRKRSGSAESGEPAAREPVKIVSKLHFVDLAGSERLKKTLAVGERQREGISINSGLLALGNVISALGDTQRGPMSYVPYRDSKLTHMLRDSLGGNAQTLLIACVSAAESNLAETVNTLKYAARARNIKNRGGVNMVSMGRASAKEVESLRSMVKKLKSEVRLLHQKLQAAEVVHKDGFSQSTLPSMAIPPPSGLSRSANASHSRSFSSILNDSLLGAESPSKIPTMSTMIQRNQQAAEELNVLKARNQSLESELEQLNDTYTELLLKFNEACREMEERQSEGFERDQRLRDREQQIRRLTSHSQHGKRPPTSAAAVEAEDAQSRSIAHTLRQKRRSARLSMTHRPLSENEGLDALDDGADLVPDEAVPPVPEMPRLDALRNLTANGDDNKDSNGHNSNGGSNSGFAASEAATAQESDSGPGAAEFDAILEEYDESVRELESELNLARETIDGLKLQLSMQETKAIFAEKLNASQLAQIDTLRAQLAKAREAGQEEEQRRRAIEAELEEANFNAETNMESVANEWRLELQHVDEQWTERWEAAQAEHEKELAEQREETNKVCAQLEAVSSNATASQPTEEHPSAAELEQQNTALRSEVQKLESSLSKNTTSVQALESQVEMLKRQAQEAEARAAAAEEALEALRAHVAAQREDAVSAAPRAVIDKPRNASDRIVLSARNSISNNNGNGGGAEAQDRSPAADPELDVQSMTPSEYRLRNLKNRHSTVVHANALSPTPPAAEKFASYPELRLVNSLKDSEAVDPVAQGQAGSSNESHIQNMLRQAAAEVDREADFEEERRSLLEKINELKEIKKELQEHNSQMKNIMRDLGDRLVRLAEENDLLEAKANERDSLAEEAKRLAEVVGVYEEQIQTLTAEAKLHKSEDKARPGAAEGEAALEAPSASGTKDGGSASRPQSVDSYRSAAEVADSSASEDMADANYDLIQLQAKLDIVEADLAEAMLSTEEHKSKVGDLLHELETCRGRIAELEEELVSADSQLEEARREAQHLGELARHAKELENELKTQRTLVTCLQGSLSSSEEQAEEAKLSADRYANELLRTQAEAKAVAGQLEGLKQQLEDARSMVISEARDRDIWKGRCQDLREEVDELRSKRRQSKILCF
ncbi:hypothetical protein GGI12_002172 [Dipsacomyces acuminosporus]|nr:hypothetical protein GGI12_002172 [Dipsacomyces acuminosporus]